MSMDVWTLRVTRNLKSLEFVTYLLLLLLSVRDKKYSIQRKWQGDKVSIFQVIFLCKKHKNEIFG